MVIKKTLVLSTFFGLLFDIAGTADAAETTRPIRLEASQLDKIIAGAGPTISGFATALAGPPDRDGPPDPELKPGGGARVPGGNGSVLSLSRS